VTPRTDTARVDTDDRARRRGAGLRRLLAEPVVQFLAAGGLIFGIYTIFGTAPVGLEDVVVAEPGSELGRIELTVENLGNFRAEFEWMEGRAPTAAELQALVDDWVADEILFREALRSGLHRVDAKIREQLIDHMRLLHAGDLAEATDAELLDHYLDNMDRYYTGRKLTFDQVYFEAAPTDPDALLRSLRSDQPVVGDTFWLGPSLVAYDENMLRSSFGGEFLAALLEAEPDGAWFGPVPSGRGFHFVRLLERRPATPLPFEVIRDQVLEDWRRAELEARLARFTAEKAPDYRLSLPEVQPEVQPDVQPAAPSDT